MVAIAAIDSIFHARRIAVVGATERAGYGARFLNTLLRTGFSGALYPINPSREQVFGLPGLGYKPTIPCRARKSREISSASRIGTCIDSSSMISHSR